MRNTSNYTVQSMKFEFLLSRDRSSNELTLASYLYSYTHICMYGSAYATKVQVKTRLASTVQAGVLPVSLLRPLQKSRLIREATVSVANGYTIMRYCYSNLAINCFVGGAEGDELLYHYYYNFHLNNQDKMKNASNGINCLTSDQASWIRRASEVLLPVVDLGFSEGGFCCSIVHEKFVTAPTFC